VGTIFLARRAAGDPTSRAVGSSHRHGAPVPILYVQRDGTGVPVVKKETDGRKSKAEGQPAHTREAKLGCVFTQTAWDEEGFAIRDPDSITYTGAIETAEAFGKRLYVEAWKRGWSRAQKKVVMGDGAEWIWNLAGQHFPGAVQIVDLYHARRHLWAPDGPTLLVAARSEAVTRTSTLFGVHGAPFFVAARLNGHTYMA
jgi:hypothetical protein